MKLQAKVGDDKFQIEIKKVGRDVTASIDGREYTLEVSEPEPKLYMLADGTHVTETFVSPRPESGDSFTVTVGRHSVDVSLSDPKRLRSVGHNDDHEHGIAEIRTAMPGKVIRVLVETGSEIEKGDGVLVVEAMKMQNELKSPKAGAVREIRVTEGATVAAGDVLAVIE